MLILSGSEGWWGSDAVCASSLSWSRATRSCSCLEHCPGAAPSLSFPSAERAWKNLPGDRGLLVRKGVSAIGKKNYYWQAKKIQGLFYPLRTNDAFTFLIHISRCSDPPAVAVCLCPSHKQQVFVLSPCLALPPSLWELMPLGSVILISNNLRAASEHLLSIPWAWRFMGFMLALELFLHLTSTCWGCFCPWSSSTGKCGNVEVWGSEHSENTEQTWAQPSPDGISGPVRGAAALKA